MPTNVAALLPQVCAIARQAGAAIMAVYATEFTTAQKADGTPVTEADTASEALILPALRRVAPGIPVVSEENMADGAAPDLSAGRFWLVDPLDGTREFMKRNDEFTVNIGLIVDFQLALGVLYAPALDDLYYAAGPGTAMRVLASGAPAPISCRAAPAAGLDVMVSRSHRQGGKVDQYLADKPVHSLVPCGSALKFGRLAAGQADLYPRFGPTCEWDTAAGHAILRAAGGDVETVDGTPLAYAKTADKFLNPGFIAHGRR